MRFRSLAGSPSKVPSSPFGDNRGFSLIEVLISVGIIVILTALVMFRYGTFNSAVLLKNQAFELALDLREAQAFAISVRSDLNEFREEYGIYVSESNNQQYIFFQDGDTNEPPRYGSGEELSVVTLDPRFVISDICIDEALPPCASPDDVHISFTRPNFDATIAWGSGGGEHDVVDIYISAEAEPTFTRSVRVRSTGQISVR